MGEQHPAGRVIEPGMPSTRISGFAARRALRSFLGGRLRSGCGAALVGDPDQVRAKLEAYRTLGIEAFILSGYPHLDECDRFARYVLPALDHAPLSFEPG